MGKVICVLGISHCHITYHNFQFKALICFYFIARVKCASFPGELSHVHYSFCAVWSSAPKWATKSWKFVVWEWQKAGSVRDLVGILHFQKRKTFQSHVNYYIKNAGCCASYFSCEFGRQAHLQANWRHEKTQNYTMAKILQIHLVSLEICEKNTEEGGYLRCLKLTCFATHWVMWLCKKVKFSLFQKQLDVKTLGWSCLLDWICIVIKWWCQCLVLSAGSEVWLIWHFLGDLSHWSREDMH